VGGHRYPSISLLLHLCHHPLIISLLFHMCYHPPFLLLCGVMVSHGVVPIPVRDILHVPNLSTIWTTLPHDVTLSMCHIVNVTNLVERLRDPTHDPPHDPFPSLPQASPSTNPPPSPSLVSPSNDPFPSFPHVLSSTDIIL
jgi:hypothetical protein